MYLQKQSQGLQLQAYFNQMQIVEGSGSYPPGQAMGHQDPAAPLDMQGAMAAVHQHQPHPQQQQTSSQPSPLYTHPQTSPQPSPPYTHPQILSPLMEPSAEGLIYDLYDPYLGHYPHLLPGLLPPGGLVGQLQNQLPEGLRYSYPGCEQAQGPPPSAEALYPEQYEFSFPLDPGQPPPAPTPGPPGPGQAPVAGYVEGLTLPDLQNSSFLDTEMMETVDSQHGFVLVN